MGREGEGYEHPCLNDILILYAERGAGKGDREGGHHQFKWCIYWFLCHIKLRGRRGSEMGGGGREGKETGEEEGKWENRTSLPLPLVCEHEAIGTWEGEGKEEGEGKGRGTIIFINDIFTDFFIMTLHTERARGCQGVWRGGDHNWLMGVGRGRDGEGRGREGRGRLVLHLLSLTLSISLTLSPLPPSASLMWWSNWQMHKKMVVTLPSFPWTTS